MKCSAKLYIIVIIGTITAVGCMFLNSGLFKSNEGMDNDSSASTPTKKEEAAKKTLLKLKSELEKLTPDLNTNKTELAKIQQKIDLLTSQIQAKQSEIDKVQNQIQLDYLAKTA